MPYISSLRYCRSIKIFTIFPQVPFLFYILSVFLFFISCLLYQGQKVSITIKLVDNALLPIRRQRAMSAHVLIAVTVLGIWNYALLLGFSVAFALGRLNKIRDCAQEGGVQFQGLLKEDTKAWSFVSFLLCPPGRNALTSWNVYNEMGRGWSWRTSKWKALGLAWTKTRFIWQATTGVSDFFRLKGTCHH